MVVNLLFVVILGILCWIFENLLDISILDVILVDLNLKLLMLKLLDFLDEEILVLMLGSDG